jgi:glutamate synthase (NADPH/NADH) large chain
MICDINNRKSHTLVQDALQILVNLTHRGACGCDETTGDGAGILIQKPHRFLKKRPGRRTFTFRPKRTMRPAWCFCPRTKTAPGGPNHLVGCRCEEKGLIFLGWRTVPVNPEAAGDLARRVMPDIRMAVCGQGRDR